MSKMVRLERYKVAYLDPLGTDVLRSEMHPTEQEAVDAGRRSAAPHLVMEWLDGDDGRYGWRVLPHGAYRSWRLAQSLHRYRWQLGIGLSALALSAFILYGEAPRRGDDA